MSLGNSSFGFSGGGGGGVTPIIGGGTLNYIAKFTPNGTTIGNSLLFDNGTSVGLGTATPNASSILDLTSTSQGFLTPRMTTVQRDAIVAPVNGLFIYNTTTSFFNYWNGISWTQIDTSTGGDVSGSGTTNRAVLWTDGANSVIGDSTWYYSTNDYLPVTTGSNIGDATHRIGTIFMASVFDYANDLTFYNGTLTTMTLSTAGNLGVGVTSSATVRVNIQGSDSTSSNTALQILNSSTANIALFRNDGIVNIGNAVVTNQRLVRIGQGTATVDLGSLVTSTSVAAIYLSTSATPTDNNYNFAGLGVQTFINAASSGTINFRIAGVNTVAVYRQGSISFTPASTTGTTSNFSIVSSVNTNAGSGTESISFDVDMRANMAHATNVLVATQRDALYRARTHSFGTAGGVITQASTFAITGAAIGGTNATLTNSSALMVEAGAVTNVTNSYGATFNAQTGATNNYVARFLGGNTGFLTSVPNSTVHINGSVSTAFVQKTSAYIITSTDFSVDCTSGTFNVTLPTAVGITGRIYIIKNSGVGTITVDTTSSQTIDGSLTQSLAASSSIWVQSNGSNWIVLA